VAARFQTFDDPADPSLGTKRIALLREELARRGLHGFIVPRADEHQSEYVPPHAERLSWLTGFTGSAGTAIILADKAALLVDGRYTLQAANQVDMAVLTPVPSAETSAEAWIAANLPADAAFGYDPWLHTVKAVAALEAAVVKAGARLVPVEGNPVDAVWSDRPSGPAAPVRIHPERLAGESTPDKLARIQGKLAAESRDALLVSDPHNLAWAFNLRGGDVGHTPLALGYAIIPREGRPSLFFAPGKVTNDAGDVLGQTADILPADGLGPALDRLGAARASISVDSATGAAALASRIEQAGGTIKAEPDPITLMKAVKNAAEIAGARAAHLRDGAAVTRFLHWLHRQDVDASPVTEIDAVEALERFRDDTGALKDVSFPTISGSGPNGAIVHYRVTRATDRRLGAGELFLVDSGAQYEDGTTDITRTIAIGTPSAEMRDRFTRVLKGHIAVARAVFPKGTSGAQIDAFARRPLWEAGLDFDHGTGHGIGSYLSVHEGPQRISKLGTAVLEPGMLLSNEPGYYKTGQYGIRIENLILVKPHAIPDGERPMLGFETLTLAPIDRALIDARLLDETEIAWLDAYHARVRHEIAPLVDGATRDWLVNATMPLL
jgi:Xaa-Pro aminopeptidase